LALIAPLFALAIAAQATAPPADDRGISCIYDTVGADRMQRYDAQIDAGTLSIGQFATETAAERRTCIQKGVWKQQKQVEISFNFALLMAQFVAAGKSLQAGGINPDDVLGRWDAMPPALRAALKMGVATYSGGREKFVQDVRAFLTAQTPAKQAPYLGHALGLLVAYGEMLRAADDYHTAATAP
jgi:hypothetical protein